MEHIFSSLMMKNIITKICKISCAFTLFINLFIFYVWHETCTFTVATLSQLLDMDVYFSIFLCPLLLCNLMDVFLNSDN